MPAFRHHPMPTQVQPPPAKLSEQTRLVTVTLGETVKAFLPVRDVASLLGLSSSTVRADIRTGRIPSMRMGQSGRRVLVPASWIARLQAQAEAVQQQHQGTRNTGSSPTGV